MATGTENIVLPRDIKKHPFRCSLTDMKSRVELIFEVGRRHSSLFVTDPTNNSLRVKSMNRSRPTLGASSGVAFVGRIETSQLGALPHGDPWQLQPRQAVFAVKSIGSRRVVACLSTIVECRWDFVSHSYAKQFVGRMIRWVCLL